MKGGCIHLSLGCRGMIALLGHKEVGYGMRRRRRRVMFEMAGMILRCNVREKTHGRLGLTSSSPRVSQYERSIRVTTRPGDEGVPRWSWLARFRDCDGGRGKGEIV